MKQNWLKINASDDKFKHQIITFPIPLSYQNSHESIVYIPVIYCVLFFYWVNILLAGLTFLKIVQREKEQEHNDENKSK